jgi:hypothetical protein
MLRLVKVLGRVLVFRRVTTAHVAAFETQAQMYPRITHLETFFAAFAAGRDLLNLFGMTAGFRHKSPHFRFPASTSRNVTTPNAGRETIRPRFPSPPHCVDFPVDFPVA